MIRQLITMALGAALLGPSAGVAQDAVVAPGAAEDTASKPKTGISAVLKTMDWRVGNAQVLEVLKGEIDARYDEVVRETRDAVQIDRLLRKKRAELSAIRKTLIQFNGQQTGYESSLIGRDFEANQGESVLRVDENAAQRYYFFRNDALWKVLVAYNTTVARTLPFASFVDQAEKKYGPATRKAHVGEGAERQLMRAFWEDELTVLVVEDRTAFFGTFVMKFLQKGEGQALEAARVARPKAVIRDELAPEMDSMLDDIMEEGEGVADDVVDRLTQQSHQVDLERGRPAYEPILRGPPQPSEAELKRAAKRRAKKTRRSSRKKKPAVPAEPQIIY